MAVMRPFNLLNYPGLSHQRRVFHRCWSSAAGLLVGCLLAWSGQQWQMAETLRLQLAHNELQSEWLTRKQAAQEAAQEQSRQRLLVEQAAHLQQIAAHQQAWLTVHEHMQDMAGAGLRLLRLQSDIGHVVWHGEFNRFEAMASARQSLSEQWGHDVALKEVTTGPAAQVNFVWQTTWPALIGARPAQGELTGKAKP
jgi:hypothetical protein